eukprot:5099232-Prymnesium_polylepis.1
MVTQRQRHRARVEISCAVRLCSRARDSLMARRSDRRRHEPPDVVLPAPEQQRVPGSIRVQPVGQQRAVQRVGRGQEDVPTVGHRNRTAGVLRPPHGA